MFTFLGLWCLLAMDLRALELEVVNDTVMGGVSTSAVRVVDDGWHFVGELSLERNGGFASFQSRPKPLGLDDARALRLHVRGDGRTYQLTARRDDVPLRAGSYRAAFTAPPQGAWIEVPLASMTPSSFGRPVLGAPTLDAAPGRIVSLGVLLGDKQPGPFSLHIDAIEVVRRAAGRAEGHAAVVQTLAAAIRDGVPLFNAGDVEGCRSAYAAALGSVRDHASLTEGERAVIQAALAADNPAQPAASAWALRHAMDTVLASAPATR